jgi:ribose transport system substrate-binding protein
MKLGRMVIVLLGLLLSGVLLAPAGATPKQTRLAFIIKTLSNPYFVAMKEGAEQEARAKGVTVEFGSILTETDSIKQLEFLEATVEKKYNAIIIVPIDATNLIPGIVKATNAHIPVVNVDNTVDRAALAKAGGNLATVIVSDRKNAGVLMARALVRALIGRGNILVIRGLPGVAVEELTYQGFRSVIARHPEIKIVSEQAADWDRQKAFDVAWNALREHPDVSGIFASNDNMALGAAQAAKSAGKKLLIVGLDATDEGKQAIKQGLMLATAAQFPDLMGKMGVDAALDVLVGKALPETMFAPVKLITARDLKK